MKLHEEFKLYENMWDEDPNTNSEDLSSIIITALDKAFRRNDNILIEAPHHANATGICEKWVSDKGRSLTHLSAMTETESELKIKLKQAYSREHIVLLEDVERLKPPALSKLFAIICEDGMTAFTICVVGKALPFSSWTVRVFPVVVHGFTDEAIDESIDTEKIYKLSCTGSDLDDAIAIGKVPTYLKNVKEVELVDRDRVPVKKYNQICKFLYDLGIKVTKGASGREPAEVAAKSITEDWYGADSEVEFETSVYPDIAKYFGLKDDEVVTYAYYYTDEVIVNYDDAYGRSHEIEKHVPIDQVEEWFKAGYTILDEAKKPLTEARSVADIEAEIARLQQELEQAKIAEKKASYGGNFPKTVWTWDIYLEPTEKGTWTGIENDLVFETEDKALDAAWELLNELDDEGELDGDPDDYYVEAFEVPLSNVSASILKFNKLAHLI